MQNKRRTIAFHKNSEELFISEAIIDLKHGNTTYVYKECILDKLKDIFEDLTIKKEEFYWSVKNNKVKSPKEYKPRKLNRSKGSL